MRERLGELIMEDPTQDGDGFWNHHYLPWEDGILGGWKIHC